MYAYNHTPGHKQTQVCGDDFNCYFSMKTLLCCSKLFESCINAGREIEGRSNSYKSWNWMDWPRIIFLGAKLHLETPTECSQKRTNHVGEYAIFPESYTYPLFFLCPWTMKGKEYAWSSSDRTSFIKWVWTISTFAPASTSCILLVWHWECCSASYFKNKWWTLCKKDWAVAVYVRT